MASRDASNKPHLPTAAELRQAAELLGVPPGAMPPGERGGAREVTELLAVLDAWVTAFLSFNVGFVDVDMDHQAQLDVLARAETGANSGGVPTSLMSSAIWRLRVAMCIVVALSPPGTDDDSHRDPAHPGGTLVALLQAAVMILDDWRQANSDTNEAVDYGGRRYGIANAQYGPVARELAGAALDAMDAMSSARANISLGATPVAWMPLARAPDTDWIENIHYPRWPIPDHPDLPADSAPNA